MIVFPILLGSALAVPHTTAPLADQAMPAALSVTALSAMVLQEEEADPEPEGLWHGNLDIGLSKSEGNADIESYAVIGKAVREIDVHRYTFNGLWYYATQDDVRTQRRALGSVKYDQFFMEKTYFYVNALAETNEQAALDLRWIAGGGLGYQFRDDPQWKINLEAGLAYYDEQFDIGDERTYMAGRLAWELITQITTTLQFGHDGVVYPSFDDKDDVYGIASTYFEALLSTNMTARLSWLLTYDNTPATVNGQTLDRADNLYLLSVGWVF